MRHLHPRDDPLGAGAGRKALSRPDKDRARWQLVPLYRLRGDLSGDREGEHRRQDAHARWSARGAKDQARVGQAEACASQRRETEIEMKGAVSPLQLVRPKTIHDALDKLRKNPDLVPLAGCTDLYVSLNFG